MPSDLDKEFEKQHLTNLQRLEKQIRKIYDDSIHQVVVAFSSISYNGQTFYLKDYPLLLNRINEQIKKLRARVYGTVINGIETSWDLSNTKNNLIVDKRLAGADPTRRGKQILYHPNLGAKDSFVKRKHDGLNLSDRIWNANKGFRTEMEAGLGVGVSEGRSAAEMASDLKRYQLEPEKLFRKIRQDDGTFKLSKAAQEYHPGQGVYRSSYMNALRVTASETNMAYRSSDHERWLKLPFVIGIEIVLSKSHPLFDICDALVGVYPKTYKHVGFHPRCLCYTIPVQVSDKEYDKYEDAILNGDKLPTFKMIQAIPVKARKWLTKNADRIAGWKTTPYFVKDNQSVIGEFLQ